jgi:hypothetical protein
MSDESDLSRRMDTQDTLLREIRDMIVGHIAEEAGQKKVDGPVAKALDEIVLLWRASKIIVPVAVTVAVGLWAFMSWWKEHFKWS